MSAGAPHGRGDPETPRIDERLAKSSEKNQKIRQAAGGTRDTADSSGPSGPVSPVRRRSGGPRPGRAGPDARPSAALGAATALPSSRAATPSPRSPRVGVARVEGVAGAGGVTTGTAKAGMAIGRLVRPAPARLATEVMATRRAPAPQSAQGRRGGGAAGQVRGEAPRRHDVGAVAAPAPGSRRAPRRRPAPPADRRARAAARQRQGDRGLVTVGIEHVAVRPARRVRRRPPPAAAGRRATRGSCAPRWQGRPGSPPGGWMRSRQHGAARGSTPAAVQFRSLQASRQVVGERRHEPHPRARAAPRPRRRWPGPATAAGDAGHLDL